MTFTGWLAARFKLTMTTFIKCLNSELLLSSLLLLMLPAAWLCGAIVAEGLSLRYIPPQPCGIARPLAYHSSGSVTS